MTPITPELVLRAYTIGYFPMAEHRTDNDIFWVCPDQRGVIPLDGFHIPRKMRGVLLAEDHIVTCNADFRGVIAGCAEAKPRRPDTWINPQIMDLFIALHKMGFAHSIEVHAKEKLVGGLYGVALGGAFFGESMFSRQENASKIALLHLIARLRHGGFQLLDTQFVTKHLEQFGAVEIPKDDYIEKLEAALRVPAKFPCDADPKRQIIGALLQSTKIKS